MFEQKREKRIEIKKEYLVNNNCYKTNRTISPSGIVVYSTGCNQKMRY